MLAAKNSDPQQESLQITEHDKFYSRLLSKESSLAPSFRVYYGGASGAVPFLWESQPGTPKNTITTSTLPPLTPPPSYHCTAKKKNTKKSLPKINSLMHTILPRLTPKRTTLLSSSPLSSPSVSSSGSSTSHRCSRFSSPQSSFDDNESDDEGGSPTSTLCSRAHRRENGSFSGCYSMVIVKNALLSFVSSHGSSQGTTAA